MEFRDVLKEIVEGKSLSAEDAEFALKSIMSGELSEAVIASFLTSLAIRKISSEELLGFAKAMRALAVPVQVSTRPLLDTCGTG